MQQWVLVEGGEIKDGPGSEKIDDRYIEYIQLINVPPGVVATQATIEIIDGRCVRTISAATSGPMIELERTVARSKRDRLLAESDWTDTLSAKTRLGDALYNAWQDYRQILRDVPQQPGFPWNIAWPEPPSPT